MKVRVLLSLTLPLMAQTALGQDHLWSQRFGDEAVSQEGRSIATDPAGNVLITGFFDGTVDFGGGELTSAGLHDIFLGKFDSQGNHLWSMRFGDTDDQASSSVTADSGGNILLAGGFRSTVDFGGGSLTSEGSEDVFLAKFDSSGNHLWSQRFGDAGSEFSRGVTADQLDNIIITGEFRLTIDFGGDTLIGEGGGDVFFARFDPSGNHLWSLRFGDMDEESASSVSSDAEGNVYLAGGFSGDIDFGGGILTSAGLDDIFLAKFDSAGSHIWSQRFGSIEGGQYSNRVAADNSGNAIITGEFRDFVDFGGGPLTSTGGLDIFLAKFDSQGNHLWSQRFGDDVGQYGTDLAVDVSSNVIIAGEMYGTVDFGGGPLTSQGLSDVYVARFDSTGAHLWSQTFGSDNVQYTQSVAVDSPTGNVFITGLFVNTIDLGGGVLTSVGGRDIFLAKFAGDNASSVEPHSNTWSGIITSSHPNPFGSSVTISYTVAGSGPVHLEIYDIAGRRVAASIRHHYTAGKHRVLWDAAGLSTGIYFYSVFTSTDTVSRKITLQR